MKYLNFYENVTDPKFALLVQFGTPTTAWRWSKSKKSKYLPRKTLIIELLKYTKIKVLSSLPFPEKAQLLVTLFELFLVGNWGRSHFQDSIKFWHLTYFINMISGQFNVKTKQKKEKCNTFKFCRYGWQMTFQKNFNTIFRVWLLFSLPRPNVWKKEVEYYGSRI